MGEGCQNILIGCGKDFSVAKYCAADFYFKFKNGDYIIKGNNVT